MTQRTRHRELPAWVRALLVFIAGFGAVWHCSSRRGSQPGESSRDAPARDAPERAADAPRAPAVAGDTGMRRPAEGMKAPGETRTARRSAAETDIRTSRLPEWMRFRYEHSKIALSTEMAVRFELEAQVHVGDAKAACAARQPDASSVMFDISAEIEIRGRDATVRGWGCDTEPGDVRAGAICDCFLEQLPGELHVVVPPEVRDADLVPYDSMLSLWL